MKKIIVSIILITSLIACKKESEKRTNTPVANTTEHLADFSGSYSSNLNAAEGAYVSGLEIIKKEDVYTVAFTASEIKGKPGCAFSSKATQKNDTLFVAITDREKPVTMIITRLKNEDGVNVFTKEFENRLSLMYYCSGGGSLAGDYYIKSTTQE